MPERDPLEIAAGALRHRDRSRREVDERLERAGVADEARAETLEALERLGYVDDARYAAARAATLAGRGRGDAAIRHDLEQRGVEGELVEGALAALEPEAGRARALVQRLGATPGTAARLARNGFAPESVEAAVGAEIAGDGA